MRKEKEQLKIERRNRAALTEFVERYYPEILRYCEWHAPGINAAEDAAQEVFLKAARYFDSKEFNGNFRAFLYQIAKNTCLDMKKNRWCSVLNLDDVMNEPYKTDPLIQHAEHKIDIEIAFSELDEIEREIVQLRFGQELKLREIGVILNLPLRTVQSKLRKAMQKMKNKLEVK